MTDDGVREVAGVRCSVEGGWATIVVHEGYGDRIVMDSNYKERFLTPAQARRLAARLYRLARRIDQRAEVE